MKQGAHNALHIWLINFGTTKTLSKNTTWTSLALNYVGIQFSFVTKRNLGGADFSRLNVLLIVESIISGHRIKKLKLY